MSELVQLKSGGDKSREIASGAETSLQPLHKGSGGALEAIRARLGASTGKKYWRSLEELADTAAFQEFLHREFPSQASEFTDPVGRRRFLKLMGASLALAGLAACTRQPPEYIAPYARQPEDLVPGRPLFYATAMSLGGVGTGILVESHEGRPTKIEGNPDHPASLGATDVFSQASLLGLYDPDRSQTVTYIGDERPWSSFLGAIRAALIAQRPMKGAGLRILTETVTSPTLASQIRGILTDFPSAKWHQYDAAGNDNTREGSRLAFGQYANAIYHFDKADVVVALDSDFLSCGPANLRYARDFASKRRLEAGKSETNRLYVIESAPSNTGSVADNRLPVRPSEVEPFARALGAALGLATSDGQLPKAVHSKWVAAIVADLKKSTGSSIVIAGEAQPPIVHAIAHSINAALGNVGKTVEYTDPVEANPVNGAAMLAGLVQDMTSGQVEVLMILGGNPVYNAPVDLNFAEAMNKVRLRVHFGLYNDETSELCQWHVNEAHYLESWSDTRAYDGTVSIVQPLIAPLYGGKSAHEVLAVFSDQPERSAYDIVRAYWIKQRAGGGSPQAGTSAASTGGSPGPKPSADFEQFWRKALHDGMIPNTALPTKTLAASGNLSGVAPAGAPSSEFEIAFRPDPTVHDGQFANLGWLQELPKPISKLTWDNAAYVSPATARKLQISQKEGSIGRDFTVDILELQYQGRTLLAPAWIMPGHPDDSLTITLGYGRTRSGRVGNEAGFNAYSIRTSDAPWFGSGVRVRNTGDRYSLASTQLHHLTENRDLVRSGTVEEYRRNPSLRPEEGEEEKLPSLYPAVDYPGHRWGMAIDLNSCIGCNACIVACQSENNIPVVGKEQVLRNREMHWLRVDSYFKGEESNPETYFQPVPCMHCEDAPCEVVCPVAATVHSAEGLNDMVYNRCVGTRYCSNNCPYKVRRFNFLLYQDWQTPTYQLMRNPDVSVRSRGVMEKCTYCVQRIQRAKLTAEKEDRTVRDGDVVTACEGACPTRAIVFGDISDSESEVAKLKSEERSYGLLADLNTKPRTTYLGAVRNPNPELREAEKA